MFNIWRRTYIVHHGIYNLRVSLTEDLGLLKKCPSLCLYGLSTLTIAKEESFTVSYLVNTCGLSLNSALSASKKIQLNSHQKPDSVMSMFKTYGFSQTQISKILPVCPRLLMCKPEVLLPKLQFFGTKGASGTDVAKIFSQNPHLFDRSLDNYIIPNYDLLKNFLQSDEKTILVLKRASKSFFYDFESIFAPKLNLLLDNGVPVSNIEKILIYQPQVFAQSLDRFKTIMEEVKEMGLNPLQFSFLSALVVVSGLSKSTWERKVDVYKRWGWSEEDVLTAFKRYPKCMAVSENKLMALMDVLVNKMGYAPSLFVKHPMILSMSLEKRIIPRSSVIKFLVDKGLLEKSPKLYQFFSQAEEHFLKRYVNCYEEGPQLLKLYRGDETSD